MRAKFPILFAIAMFIIVGPPSFEKYQQISIGENLRDKIVAELIDEHTTLAVLRDPRVKGVIDYGYFSGRSLDYNGLKIYLERGRADHDPDFWAVLLIHDLRPQLDIPVEERNLPSERRLFIWSKGQCNEAPCQYDQTKLVEVSREDWSAFELKLIELNREVRDSGFLYAISFDVLVDRNNRAVTVTVRVARNALNSIDRLFGELFSSSPPQYWYSSFSTTVDLFSKEVTINR